MTSAASQRPADEGSPAGARSPRSHPAVYGLLLLAVVFALRIFYAGYVWADEGLWFTAANELLRGKSLYTQIWFDKPPAVAWTYAALFRVFGASLLTVRLFTIAYATAVCLALWHIGKRLWGDGEGRLAALLYALYNATWIHSQVQPMAVDQLMLLPYLYSGYFFLTARMFWSGLLAAVAFSLNPKAAALFPFFLILAFALRRSERESRRYNWLFNGSLLALGFMAGTVPWALYLQGGERWHYYARDFWGWGFSYVTVYSPWQVLLNGVRRTLNYAGFHIALFIGLGLLLWKSRAAREKPALAERFSPNTVLLIWLGISFLGVAAGGRFFPRYFYQVLPFLCLLAARGLSLYREGRSAAPGGTNSAASAVGRLRAAGFWTVVFWLAVAFALARFHHRAVFLAYEKITGRQTNYMSTWRDPAIDRDSRLVAQHVRGSLFVWGYRPEIYFYCGCEAAASYLSDQPLTGVPADIHLSEARNVAPGRAAEDRARLLGQLRRSMPDYVVDGLGPYNPALSMTEYPELREFLASHYQETERIGQAIVYTRKP